MYILRASILHDFHNFSKIAKLNTRVMFGTVHHRSLSAQNINTSVIRYAIFLVM